jgi:hypothetical protein
VKPLKASQDADHVRGVASNVDGVMWRRDTLWLPRERTSICHVDYMILGCP